MDQEDIVATNSRAIRFQQGIRGIGEVPSSALEVLAAVAAANVVATSVVVAATIEPM